MPRQTNLAQYHSITSQRITSVDLIEVQIARNWPLTAAAFCKDRCTVLRNNAEPLSLGGTQR